MRYTSTCTCMPSDPLDGSRVNRAPAASGRDRRRDPRYPLVAEARVTEIGSGAEFMVRISDLSISGCYLDFPNPLPDGTDIILKISRDDGVFETNAKVVFILPRMGMGVRFTDTKPTQQAILSRWIAQIAASES
jgi:PilZ domain